MSSIENRESEGTPSWLRDEKRRREIAEALNWASAGQAIEYAVTDAGPVPVLWLRKTGDFSPVAVDLRELLSERRQAEGWGAVARLLGGKLQPHG